MTTKQSLTFCLIAIGFIINACCKAECISRTVTISFFKLRAVNADSISILRYALGSNYSQWIDSNFYHYPVPANDTSFSKLADIVFSEHDWKIINHSLNKEYRLNNFETEKVKCFGEKSFVVRSFSLDGIRKQGDHAELN